MSGGKKVDLKNILKKEKGNAVSLNIVEFAKMRYEKYKSELKNQSEEDLFLKTYILGFTDAIHMFGLDESQKDDIPKDDIAFG
jgi:hypothetical protein